MGYYTNYKLDIDKKDYSEELEKALNDYYTQEYGRQHLLQVFLGKAEQCKWYDHEEDMREFSELFPDIVFTLKGEGEESNDLWRKHFKNGKMQYCRAMITFPAYDESKLE